MGERKQYTGTVVSDKMQKTVIVRVIRRAKHPKYGKIARISNKFKVHDEKGVAHMDDVVRIEQSRPISKDKRFRLVEVVKKSGLPRVELKEEPK